MTDKKDDEPTYHPEEVEDAHNEGRPVMVHRLLRYDHLKHELPIGALVEVDIEVSNETHAGSKVELKGRCTLFVIDQGRDCDGTPLYRLSSIPVRYPSNTPIFSDERLRYEALATYVTKGGGYGADSLTDTGKRVVLYNDPREWLLGDNT